MTDYPAGSFELCAGFCDTYTDCKGIHYSGGFCMAYDTITGSFVDPNGIAAVRQ